MITERWTESEARENYKTWILTKARFDRIRRSRSLVFLRITRFSSLDELVASTKFDFILPRSAPRGVNVPEDQSQENQIIGEKSLTTVVSISLCSLPSSKSGLIFSINKNKDNIGTVEILSIVCVFCRNRRWKINQKDKNLQICQ